MLGLWIPTKPERSRFRWLRLAFERDASQAAEVEADSDFDGIRADAAFRALLAEGGGTTAEG